ncbi:MAG: hypothetical protein IJG38_04395, partial [Thermoguttaceae bacterium]|nr:hypothetical protein [Thermoguttaceae bacterium]
IKRSAKPRGRKGRGYVSEDAGFGATHFQSGTDLVGHRLVNLSSLIIDKNTFIKNTKEIKSCQ